MPRLGVLGWPVSHSRSPAIHNAAFAALGMADWIYQLLPVPPELFDETVRALPASGFVGANVTIPHKLAALEIADSASVAAREIGAANTLVFGPDATIHAENTDAPALLNLLPRDPAGASALVLGAGGSARAAVWALRNAGAEVSVWNRTPARAQALAGELGVRAVDAAPRADLLVNCTAAGLDARAETFSELPLDADDLGGYGCVVDLVYGEQTTALIDAARERGIETVDGLALLVAQGAIAFELWTGRAAPAEVMRQAAAKL